jgi:uncharacterized protein
MEYGVKFIPLFTVANEEERLMSKFDEIYRVNSLTLNVTNDCNLECSYCFERDKNGKKMRAEDAVAIFEKCYSNFHTHNPNLPKFATSFFGGEPLMNFEAIKAVVEYSKSKGYNVGFGLTTNLTLLTDEMIDFFEENEVFLLISIDGMKEVHDRNRCNSYDIVVENIKKLVDREMTYQLEARMTIHPEDIHTMYKGMRELIDLGLNNVYPFFITDCEWTEEQIAELEKQTEMIFQYAVEVYNDEDNKRNISIKNLEQYFETCLSYINQESIPCVFGAVTWASVGPTGDLMQCHQRHTKQHLNKEFRIETS